MATENEAGKPDPTRTAFSEFCEAWFSGIRPDPEVFCKCHPDCSPELRVMIENFIFVDQGLSDADSNDDDEPF